eukprot:TRINITY_DN13934_c0_g1_i1.p1 TRINITY_DN13934_c0_g1~~TRINITY_DN13934_c0_g1_i1.p1  ORF type:complete len:109 (-),score=23.73 TRINITY_DN13934_c0_g1_i1:34-360(-)
MMREDPLKVYEHKAKHKKTNLFTLASHPRQESIVCEENGWIIPDKLYKNEKYLVEKMKKRMEEELTLLENDLSTKRAILHSPPHHQTFTERSDFLETVYEQMGKFLQT